MTKRSGEPMGKQRRAQRALVLLALQLAACLLPDVSSEPVTASDDGAAPLAESAPVTEPSEPRKGDAGVAAPAAHHDAGTQASSVAAQHDASTQASSVAAQPPGPAGDAATPTADAAQTSESECPPGACAHGVCRELTNNYWCECDPGYMASGRECVPASGAPELRANGDGTVSVTDTNTLWQDPPPSMSFSFDAALAYCSSLSLAGHTDWQLPPDISLAKLCVLNITSPVLSESTAVYWIGRNKIVTCDAMGVERPVHGVSVARARCVHAPVE
jgi:hypothetical protein